LCFVDLVVPVDEENDAVFLGDLWSFPMTESVDEFAELFSRSLHSEIEQQGCARVAFEEVKEDPTEQGGFSSSGAGENRGVAAGLDEFEDVGVQLLL